MVDPSQMGAGGAPGQAPGGMPPGGPPGAAGGDPAALLKRLFRSKSKHSKRSGKRKKK